MIRFFAAHPTAANLLMLIFLVLGLFALPGIQRATFPDFVATAVEVRVPYPGATAADVEEAVCRRIESAVQSVENVAEIRSEARDDVGIVTLEMTEGGDASAFLTDVKTEVEAITEFPKRAERPSVRPIQRTDRVISVAITGDMPPTDLKAYAEDVRERLQRRPGLSLVTLSGFGQRQIRVEVPAVTLVQYGISAEELAGIVGVQSVDLPAGTINTPDRDVVVRFQDERRTPAALADLVIVGAPGGGEIRLGDVARITETFDPDEEKILFDGRRAALLQVDKTKQQDTLRVYDTVASFVDEELARHPRGVTLTLTQDVSSIVRDRLQMLLKNGWQGFLLVFLAMWLFFGFRYSFWVAMGLPVAFLGALFLMPLFGMTVNMLTMVAMLMALGLMMDDAIVIAENIAREMEQGGGVVDATVRGVQGVAPGVLSSFLTTVAVFAPLAFIEGDIGKVLKVVPIVLILVLAVSLVEAFLILPHHLAHALEKRKDKTPGRFRRAFDRGVAWFREHVVGSIVDVAVSWRYLTVGLVIAVFLLTVGLVRGGVVKFKAFPEIDGDVAEARLLLPAGTPLHRTEAVVDRLVAALGRVDAEYAPRQPGGQALVQHITVRFNENRDAKEQGPHVATIVADLLPSENRKARVDDVLARWRDEAGPIPDAIALAFTQPSIGPAGRPIEVRLQGDDLPALALAAERTASFFGRFDGVEDLMTDLRPGKPEALVRMRPGARSLGLTAASIAGQLRAAFHGATAAEIQVGREDLEVDVRLAEADRNRMDVIDAFRVTLPSGEAVPIGTVASVEMTRGFARIARVDRQRTVTVQGDIDSRRANVNEIMAAFQRELVGPLQADGVQVDLEGEIKEGTETQMSMIRALLIGLIGVFVLLSYQFRSYLEPITVMLAIPLALIGVIAGHLLMGLPLTMPSLLGFASLAGVVVNDSILLVEFIKRRRRGGEDIARAACMASRDRFRAVLLTSITTMAGLMPLMAETSLQAQILIPLAVSIVFGMLASTLLVLFVIPSVYTILGDLGWVTPSPADS